MELELFRHDIIQTSSSSRGTLAVLPQGEEKKTQKVAVGDLSGVIQMFSVKKGDVVSAFKNMPSNQKVTSLTLGKHRTQRDKIFVAAGNSIMGINKKGKDFFKFNTQVTETICKIDVFEKNIWSSAEYVHNQYIENKEKAFYLAPDRINAAEVAPLIGVNDYCPVLACQDRYLRIINGNDLFYEAPTPAAPCSLRFNNETHDPSNRFPNAKELLYGTEAGTLVQLLCESSSARQGFTLPNPKKHGSVRTIYSGIDFTKTGISDIVVGRDDGMLEIFDQDETGQLQQVYSIKLSESINALDGGFVTSTNVQDVVLQTFSGKVLSFAPAGGGQLLDKGDKRLKAAATEDDERKLSYENQIKNLREEMEILKGQVEVEKIKFSKLGSDHALLAVSAPFTVQDRFKLEEDEACYTLSIESAMPIFTVAIQCNIQLQLLDVPTNVAILSRSPPDEPNGNFTLATYRCQDATSRISVKCKVREGKSGMLHAFIIPNVSPKTCISVSHKIRLLCLHMRLPGEEDALAGKATNELLIAGAFSLSDMHTWVSQILNDVPPLLGGQETGSYRFQNSLLGTTLTCKYSKNEARFASDLISTLGIIHENIMREATKSNARVSVSFNPSASGLQRSIALVWPQMERQRTLKKQFNLLEGLMELKMQDPDVSYLSPEYRAVLENAEKIRTEFKEQPQHLDHLCALIKDLYMDFCKLTGITTPKQRLPMLDKILTDTRSTLDEVMDFMLNK